jgi:rubrerythrin
MVDDKVFSMLIRNIEKEYEVSLFYLRNLERLGYAKNRTKVNALAIDSIRHAQILAKAALDCKKGCGGDPDRAVLEKALKEEVGLGEIYKYEAGRTLPEGIKEKLDFIADWEERHQALVRTIR